MQGLLPPRVTSLQVDIDRAHAAIARCCAPLEKYQVSTCLSIGRQSRKHMCRQVCTISTCVQRQVCVERIHSSHVVPQAVMGLRESSWDIFYGLLSQHIKEYLPIIYTP